MRQVILLDPEDVAAMKRGEHITIHAGTQEISLGFAHVRQPRTPKPGIVCKCGRSFRNKIAFGQHLFRQKGKPGHGRAETGESVS